MAGVEQFVEEFKACRSQLPGARMPWLDSLRENAMDRFTQKGFPTTRNEAWKYTNLAPLLRHSFIPATGATDGAAPLVENPAARVVFSNGKLESLSESAISGLSVLPLGEALKEKESLLRGVLEKTDGFESDQVAALNLALMGDGLLVHVAEGTQVEAPLEVCVASSQTDGMSHLRLWVVIEKGASLTLVENFTGEADSHWNNGVSEVFVRDGGTLNHLKVQQERGYHLAQNRVVLGRGAQFHSTVLALGATISRNEVLVRFDGERGQANLNGIFLADAGEQTQHRTVMDHTAPRCVSDQLFKGIAAVGGKGLYDGRVIVRPGAQKTDSKQKSQSLLLGDGAEVDAKPQLEIYADDVKCAHGATSGQLDEGALFYLRARGISEKDARKILTEGFVNEVVDAFPHAPLRGSLKRLLAERMQRHGI